MTSTLLSLTHYYFTVQATISLVYLFLQVFKKFCLARSIQTGTSTFWRKAHHSLLLATLLIPLLVFELSPSSPFKAPVQVWSGESSKKLQTESSSFLISLQRETPREKMEIATSFFQWGIGLLWVCILGAAFAYALRLLKDFLKVRHIIRSSLTYKKIGLLEVKICEQDSIPFSMAFGRKGIVCFPLHLISNPNTLRVTLAHEFQHLRQRDTSWVYGIELIKTFFFLNPCLHLWLREIAESHEFACDEALLGQRRITQTAYGRCLLEVAAYVQQTGTLSAPSGTVGMSVSQQLLKRRMEMILSPRKPTSSKFSKAMIAAAIALTATVAMASKNSIADRRITMDQAQRIADTTSKSSGIPIVVDENVLRFLNKAAATERGRMYMRANFKRMKSYDRIVRKKITDANLPIQLMAVPFVESGYQNIDNGVGAGIWAFIPDTARTYGMKVTDDLDERFNVEKETDAAVQYYSNLYKQFGDWHLALLGYNAGESAVRNAIKKTGIRDAFRLVREKLMPKEQDYLPMTMAAIIIFENPSLIEE